VDPYIDPAALDPTNPWYGEKIANLRRADDAHHERRDVVDALPSKVVLQTTDTPLDADRSNPPRSYAFLTRRPVHR